MKLSINWLKEYIHLLETPTEIAAILTRIGLEVGWVEAVGKLSKENVAGLVIGDVIACHPHPHADRLRCTMVSVGLPEPLPIICGAPTVAVGQKVVVAPVGVTIYPQQGKPLTINKVTLRGLVSEGMLCAEDEIGWGTNHETIITLSTDLPAGTPLADYIDSVSDHVLDIELTPNRIDAASHIGVARELRAVLNRPLKDPTASYPQLVTLKSALPLSVTIHEAHACRRYVGIVVDQVQIKPSPTWLQDRLRAIGVHPTNNIVDITHFVLHEWGQPMHAFDYDRLQQKEIHIRKARPGERLVTLDQVTRNLSGQELVIADAKGSIALAGIIGGHDTAIQPHTTAIFLESAYFDPAIIRGTAKNHRIQTEASFWYERGTDPMLPPIALRRAFQLMHALAGGELAMYGDYYPDPIKPVCIDLTYDYIHKLIGHALPVATIQTIVTNLDMHVLRVDTDGFTVAVPPYRVDVTRPADVVEAMLRIYGYDRVPEPVRWHVPFVSLEPLPPSYQLANAFNPILVSQGYQEICTNPLTDCKGLQQAGQEDDKPIAILNPLSDRMTHLRNTLVISGLEAILYNINRKQPDLKLFEWGKVYYQRAGEYREQEQLGIWLTGIWETPNWRRPARAVNFQDLHALLYQLLDRWPVQFSCSPAVDPMYQQAIQWVDGQGRPLVTAGELASIFTNHLSIYQPVFFAQIDPWIGGMTQPTDESYRPVSKFPPVRRDLSLVLDQAITFSAIKQVVTDQQQPLISDMHVFDVYHGPTLGPDKKAYALSFTLQDPTKTLDEITIRTIMHSLMQAFQQQLGAVIRE